MNGRSMNGRPRTGLAPIFVSLALLCCVGAWARTSAAQSSAVQSSTTESSTAPMGIATPRPSASKSPKWYGGATLILDWTSIVLVTGGDALERQTEFDGDAVAGLGVFTYLLGGPIVHFSHSRIGKGFGSFGMRLGLPFFGALIGALSNACVHRECNAIGAGIGYRGGIVAAMTLDAAVLSFEEDPPRAVANTRKAASYCLLPFVDSKQAGLFVLGHF